MTLQMENLQFEDVQEDWWRQFVLRECDWTWFDFIYFLAIDKPSPSDSDSGSGSDNRSKLESRTRKKANLATLKRWTQKYFYGEKQFINDPGMLRVMMVLKFLDV